MAARGPLDPRLRGDDEGGRGEPAPAKAGNGLPCKNVIPAQAGIQKDPWRPSKSRGEAQLRAGAKKPRADEGGTPKGRWTSSSGAVPRLRGRRPEAKHCFAKRERADTDVGPRGCTGIIIAAGRQRQQPIEAAGATFQMARVYLAPTLGCRFRGSGNTPVGNATRSTMPVPSLNSDLIGSPPWPVGKGVNHRRRGCPHPSRRLSRSRW